MIRLHSGSTLVQERVPWGSGRTWTTGRSCDRRRRHPVATLRAWRGPADRGGGARLHRFPGARALVDALAAAHPVTVVEMGWPSSWRPADARAFVITHGASHANARAAAELLGLVPNPAA